MIFRIKAVMVFPVVQDVEAPTREAALLIAASRDEAWEIDEDEFITTKEMN